MKLSWLAMPVLAALIAGCSGGAPTSSTTNPQTPTANALVITTDKSTLKNTGAEKATVTITAVDANRNAVAGVPIKVVPDNNAVITASATETGADGSITATLDIGSDHSNRVIDILATSGSISSKATVAVTGATLTSTVGTATISASAPGTITYHLADADNVAMASVPIAIKGPTTIDAATDPNGNYVYTYTAPATPTTLDIVASAAGTTATSTITVVSGTVPVNTGTVLSASLSPSASTVSVNAAGSQTNQITLRALFVGANNIPMQNIRVRFDLDGDVNNIGGSLTNGGGTGAPAYSDANGIATTTYIAGQRSSPIDGLTIRACWSNSDFAPVAKGAACPNNQEATTKITVTDSGVSISIFTNNQIYPQDEAMTYQIKFAVQVVDSAGKAQPNVAVSGSVDLSTFYRGHYVGPKPWAYVGTATCTNEDVNRNGNNETFPTGKEDADDSGSLEPFKADAELFATVSPVEGNESVPAGTTDSSGKAYFTLEYGQNVASWDDYVLTFTALVSGTEGVQRTSGTLPVPFSVINADGAPPFVVSPYGDGDGGDGTVITDPATGKPYSLCTKPH